MPNEDDTLRSELDNLLKKADSREGAINALALLFPKAQRVLKTYVPSESEDPLERKRRQRISASEFTATYFSLDPRGAAWGRTELNAILNDPNPHNAILRATARIESALKKDRPRLRRLFLEALDGAFNAERPFTLDWFMAILAIAPTFIVASDENVRVLFQIDNLDRLRWAVRSGLDSISSDQRIEYFKYAIQNCDDISLLTTLMRDAAGDNRPDARENNEKKDYFGQQETVLRTSLMERIRLLSQNTEAFWNQASPKHILWFWWGSNFGSEVQEFTRRTMDTTVGLRGLLNATINTVRSSSGDYESVQKGWSSIVDLQELEKRAQQLLTGPDGQLASRFLAALKRGRESSF